MALMAFGVAFLVVGAAGAYVFINVLNPQSGIPTAPHNSSSTSSTSSASVAGTSGCQSSSISGNVGSYQGIASSTLTLNRFYNNGAGLVGTPSNPGSPTIGTAYGPSTGAFYGPATQYPVWYDSFSKSGVYPFWTSSALNQTATLFGQPLYAVTCAQAAGGVTSGTQNYYSESAQLYSAPTSGTTATTNVQAVIIFPSGSPPASFPTAVQNWNVQLQITQANVAGFLSLNQYGTVTNPVENYLTNQQTPSGAVRAVGELILETSQTGVSVTIPTAAQGQTQYTATSMSPIGGTAIRAWMIPINQGCLVSGTASSTNQYVCLNIPIQVYETVAQGASTVTFTVAFVDEQQPAFTVNNFAVSSAAPSLAASTKNVGGAGGAVPGFTYLTPTTGVNPGWPSPLINTWAAYGFTY